MNERFCLSTAYVAHQQMLMRPPKLEAYLLLALSASRAVLSTSPMLHMCSLSLACVRYVHLPLSSAKDTAVTLRLCQAGDTVPQGIGCFCRTLLAVMVGV